MKRMAGLLVALGLVFFAAGPVAAVLLPVASLDPKSGPAGTVITVTVTQYSPNIAIEVHEDTVNGALIGTGTTDGSGTGAFPITIPVTAPAGSNLLYICGLCSSQYPEWATRGFQVTGPAPATTAVATTTTTTTVAATTTLAATTTTPAPTTTTPAATIIAAAGDSGSSSQGILIGLIIGALAALVLLGGFVIWSRNAVRREGAPPPPAP